MVRHWTLTPAFTGSSPVSPARASQLDTVVLFLKFKLIAKLRKRCYNFDKLRYERHIMFSTDERVRYSEVDSNGVITIDAIVNYLQDCTMLHSDAIGHGIPYVSEAGEIWFLSTWQIQILRAPVLFEKIKINTIPYKFTGFLGSRNFEVLSEKGEQLIIADSTWVYLDLASQKPKKIPETEMEAYKPIGPKLDMEYAPRKIKLPPDMTECPKIPVRKDQIDTNHHVNNCEYIKTAMAAAGIDSIPFQVRAEYKKAAVMGDVFYPYIYEDDNVTIVNLKKADGVSSAVVEFTRKEI